MNRNIAATSRWLGQVIAWFVIAAFVAALVATVLIPKVAGATPYTILTSSMEPRFPPGTLMVMKPQPVEEIGVGSVITYQLKSGEPTVVTHRVVGVGINGRGERTFTTQGDANNVADTKSVRPVQIKGELWYHVPYLGYVNKYVTGKERHIAMIIVVTFLFSYAVFMFTGATRDRRRRRRETEAAS